MGSFLVYATIFVGAILAFWGYVNSNPIQSLLAYRWIGVQILAVAVYAVSSLSDHPNLTWFWFIQILSLVLLGHTVVLMAAAEALLDGLLQKMFDLISK